MNQVPILVSITAADNFLLSIVEWFGENKFHKTACKRLTK